MTLKRVPVFAIQTQDWLERDYEGHWCAGRREVLNAAQTSRPRWDARAQCIERGGLVRAQLSQAALQRFLVGILPLKGRSYMAEDMAQNNTGSLTNLELPKPTGDVRRDWELLTNVVQSRRHYWTQYLAYAMATNRELMRISDEIYPQPRFRLPNAHPAHVFASPHTTGNQMQTRPPGSGERHYSQSQPCRRVPVEQELLGAKETAGPLPDEQTKHFY